MRKRIVAGNWKMNTDVTAGTQLAAELMTLLAEKPAPDNVGVAIAVPFTHITEVARCIDQKVICLAAQNCSSESAGAYTGEVSATMLKSASVMAVLVGHSERRSYFHENHPTLARKVDQVLANGMRPVFCFGEVLEEREGGIQNRIVEAQLMESVFHLSETDFSKLILAYEPVWAIGTGKVASPEQAQEMHKYVRDLIAGRYGAAVADGTTILYGGSCKSSNAVEIFSKPDVDGGLIGGASLDAPEFHRIIHSF